MKMSVAIFVYQMYSNPQKEKEFTYEQHRPFSDIILPWRR